MYGVPLDIPSSPPDLQRLCRPQNYLPRAEVEVEPKVLSMDSRKVVPNLFITKTTFSIVHQDSSRIQKKLK
ncbi:hypothetical protein CEXT_352031 [Caerostris extrusa]|uniref:Uncharacterized protein n=1 Tax=Caerostris extrusa TaxID=172846 RepID=A0AAV4QLP9_CAEEX|nr:hypothetical protein CEXT_352031 [Caerostris extrusa]